ncbi:MAG: hypothetical protein MUF31_03090 [Akkermansiaceae bacterium]|jgi:glycogenin glucosyltransferase|nr:hypothetical protein [Akkermansiaceae bacterium]
MIDRAYLSLLATDDFLPGILVLAESLRKSGTRIPLQVLVTENVSTATHAELARQGIERKVIEAIPVPEGRTVRESRWIHIYSKLRIFEQVQFRKAVYLDADMIVCSNIDELFDHPPMSAVNAGGRLWVHSHWTGLNGGLLVIEPSRELFDRMLGQIGILDDRGEGDQGFLNSFFPDWPERAELHLDHRFNQLHLFLDAHRLRFGYRVPPALGLPEHPKRIKIIHYITGRKPWTDLEATRRKIRRNRWFQPELAGALQLWLDCYDGLRTSQPD